MLRCPGSWYVGELAREEDQLRELRAELARMKAEKTKLEKTLRSEVGGLKTEVTLWPPAEVFSFTTR